MKISRKTTKVYLLICIGINVFVYIFLWFKMTPVFFSEINISREIQGEIKNRYFLGLIVILIYYFFTFRFLRERLTKLENEKEKLLLGTGRQEKMITVKKKDRAYFILMEIVFSIGFSITAIFLVYSFNFLFRNNFPYFIGN